MKTSSVDEMTLLGFKLKRVLSCLMVVNVIEFFFGGGLYSFLGFVFHLIGYLGAHKRNHRLLATYFSASIAMIFLFVLVAFTAASAGPYDDLSSSSSFSSSSEHISSVHPTAQHLSLAYRRLFQASSVSSDESLSSSESTFPNPPASAEAEDLQLFVVLALLTLVLFVLITFLKIYSLHMAYKMRKMILAANANVLPVAVEYQPNQQEEAETARLTTPVPNDNSAYTFMQPNYMQVPYPLHMQGAPSVLPPPLMYGQQPVFYTYTPMNYPYPHQQNPTQPSDQKQ